MSAGVSRFRHTERGRQREKKEKKMKPFQFVLVSQATVSHEATAQKEYGVFPYMW